VAVQDQAAAVRVAAEAEEWGREAEDADPARAVAEAEARARDLGQVVAPVRAVVAGKVEE
jgi:hypothetical protein